MGLAAKIEHGAREPDNLSQGSRKTWDGIADLKVDVVWFMDVWERNPTRVEDNVGSPYCVRRYEVDGRLGGPKGRAVARIYPNMNAMRKERWMQFYTEEKDHA